jgi:hypothetical protein
MDIQTFVVPDPALVSAYLLVMLFLLVWANGVSVIDSDLSHVNIVDSLAKKSKDFEN